MIFADIFLMSIASNCVTSGVIHLVRKHEGGRGSSKSVRHAYKGGGVATVCAQKVPFCKYNVVFSYAKCFYHTLLILASIFITDLQNICYDYFCLSNALQSFSMELLSECLKTFLLEMGGGGGSQMGKSMYTIGGS